MASPSSRLPGTSVGKAGPSGKRTPGGCLQRVAFGKPMATEGGAGLQWWPIPPSRSEGSVLLKGFVIFKILSDLFFARMAGPSGKQTPGGCLQRGAGNERWSIPPSRSEGSVLLKGFVIFKILSDLFFARMAELVDALVSNTSGSNTVPVRSRLRVQRPPTSSDGADYVGRSPKPRRRRTEKEPSFAKASEGETSVRVRAGTLELELSIVFHTLALILTLLIDWARIYISSVPT